jgi:hypothetical protein
MGGQALDLRRSAQIVWRLRALVGTLVALGVLAGACYSAFTPAVYLSSAFVSLSPTVRIASQAAVATGAPVLSATLSRARLDLTLSALHGRVQAGRAGTALMAVTADGESPAQAIRIANAVADGYVAYVSSPNALVGTVPAQIFRPATSALGTPLRLRLFYAAGAGAASGALTGLIAALAVGRNDRRLRWRDELADATGVAVLASVRVRRPAGQAGWARLLAGYQPSAADGWQFRRVLRELGIGPAGGSSLAVLSLSRDRAALALGPQLAVFAASLGWHVALVIDSQQDAAAAGELRAACAARPAGPGGLTVIVDAEDGPRGLPAGALSVVVTVVDGWTPRVASTMRAATTVLGVAAGQVTARQLARVAASAAGDGRDIAGILLADPDPADQTTGRLPQLTRQGRYRMPTRVTSAVTEIRQ